MSEPEWVDKLTSDHIVEAVEASENPEKTIQSLSDQLTRHTKQLNQEYWDRNRFCSCGADRLRDCNCDKEKKNRFLQRRKRKVSKEIGNAPFTILDMARKYNVNLSIDVREKNSEGGEE